MRIDRSSEIRLRQLIDNIPDALYVLSVDGKVIDGNERAEQFLGYARAELRGKNIVRSGLLAEEDSRRLLHLLERIKLGDRTGPDEFALLRKNRERITVEILGFPLATARNEALLVARDITERKKSERNLEALHYHAIEIGKSDSMEQISSKTFDAISEILVFSAGAFGVVEADSLRLVEFPSPSSQNTLGPKQPLDGPGLAVRAVRTGLTQHLNDTRLDEGFISSADATGQEVRYLSELAVPVKVGSSVVAVIDVKAEEPNAFSESDRKLLEILAGHVASSILRLKQESAMSRREEKLAALHESALVLSKNLDKASLIKSIITAMEHSLGFQRGGYFEVDGNYLVEAGVSTGIIARHVKFPLDGPGITVRAAVTGKTQLIADTRLELAYLDLGSHSLSELSVPIMVDGKVVAVLNVEGVEPNAFDESDAQLLETLAMHAASALDYLRHTERLQTTIEEKTRDLLDAERMVGAARVAAMLGHDLRGPLQTIKNATYILRRFPDRSSEMTQIIETAVKLATDMLEELRQDTVEMKLDLARSDLADLIMRTIQEISIPSSIKVTLHIEEHLNDIFLDSFKIRRVLNNLIWNAIEAMPDGGFLTVTANRLVEEVSITVTDTGIGISEEFKSKLFTPFRTTKPRGTGLGLVYVKRVVEAHGGTIRFESTVGCGSTFTITLPLAERI